MDFPKRCLADIIKMYFVFCGRPAKTLHDVGRYGYGGPAYLRNQAKFLLTWKITGYFVNIQNKLMRFLPNFKITIT